ncbi:hypothetical protein IV38_GL001396 [Lactobacillus selangorensis]|uniref:HTH marR-type domain-containing protein n=1 Tax=Lactobacillus selangorensis TaxID=81857 RepID=A0A0R2FTZ9_9LACO|nr:MarR family transcriptional regulator [Lactobacillus selangorensis]KRN28396.1 hypothetical protein IV38_GL001396 [Lactobacillus selangorensis]KRN31897.1 hypothetical protein IV40_GL001183 [Lactobacillus selangorensis]
MKNVKKNLRQELHRYRNHRLNQSAFTALAKTAPQLTDSQRQAMTKLSVNELHVLTALDQPEEQRGADLVSQLDLTQGAISKLVTRLTKQKLLEKYHQPDNRRDTYLRLTPFGKEVAAAHAHYHQVQDVATKKYMNQFSKEELATVTRFLQGLNDLNDSWNDVNQKGSE